MNPLRIFFRKFGLDVRKYRPESNRTKLWQELGIQSIIDIGANTGQFAKDIRKEIPNAKIISFEPIKDSFAELCQNMADDTNFQAFNVAIGEKNQKTEINRSSYSPSSSLLKMSETHKTLYPHTRGQSFEEIEVKRLDDLTLDLAGEILIKVDVQGFEDRVIVGGRQTFAKARAIILEISFVELYQGQPSFDTLHEMVKSLGFEYRGSIQSKVEKATGKIIFEDGLFEKKR